VNTCEVLKLVVEGFNHQLKLLRDPSRRQLNIIDLMDMTFQLQRIDCQLVSKNDPSINQDTFDY